MDGRLLRDGHTHVGDFELGATESPANVGRTTVRGNGLPTRHELRHQLGDTRHRLVSYHATATTRFREYFAPEVATTVGDDGVLLTQHRGDAVQRHVPSSRRPDPPEIAYVIPTYSWSEARTTLPPTGGLKGPVLGRPVKVTTRTRTGGLRVYLRRPWFSSGDGELLGVVLKHQPWLTWVLDEASGMRVSAAAKADAEVVATRLFDRGIVRGPAVKGAGSLGAPGPFARGDARGSRRRHSRRDAAGRRRRGPVVGDRAARHPLRPAPAARSRRPPHRVGGRPGLPGPTVPAAGPTSTSSASGSTSTPTWCRSRRCCRR